MREALDLGDRRFLALAADGDGALVPGRVAVGIATPARSTLALPNTDCPSAWGPTPASAQCLRSASPPGAWSFGQSTGCPCPLEVAVPRSTHYRSRAKQRSALPTSGLPGLVRSGTRRRLPPRRSRLPSPYLSKADQTRRPRTYEPRGHRSSPCLRSSRERAIYGATPKTRGIVRSRARPHRPRRYAPRPPRPPRCA